MTDQPRPADVARALLIDSVTSREGWELPEPKAAVSIDTAVAAMLAYAEVARHRQNALAPGAGWRDIATFDSEPHGQANRVLIACGPIVGEAWYRDSDGANDGWDNGWWWAGTGPGEYASSLVIDTNDAPTHWRPFPAAPVTDPAS